MRHDTTQPPTLNEIVETLERFEVPPSKMGAAALHLATPRASVCGIDVHIRENQYLWRGRSVRSGFGVEGTARRVTELAVGGWRPGDERMDLGGSCLKPVRSGAHNLIAGAFLYGSCEVLCGVEIENPEAVAEAWLRGGHVGSNGVVEIAGEAYLTSGDERVVIIHGLRDQDLTDRDQGGVVEDPEVVGLLIQQMLDLDTVEAVGIGSRFTGTLDIDYIGTISDAGSTYSVVVPCTVGRALSIGAPHGAASPNVIDWYNSRKEEISWWGVYGYSPIEPARLEPGWVARHDASGISVILRRG
jgi:hypothetical protein